MHSWISKVSVAKRCRCSRAPRGGKTRDSYSNRIHTTRGNPRRRLFSLRIQADPVIRSGSFYVSTPLPLRMWFVRSRRIRSPNFRRIIPDNRGTRGEHGFYVIVGDTWDHTGSYKSLFPGASSLPRSFRIITRRIEFLAIVILLFINTSKSRWEK